MIDFLKYRRLYFSISFIIILIGVVSIISGGFKYSIDFVGGTNLEYRFKPPVSEVQVKSVFKDKNIEIVDFSLMGDQLSARTKSIDEVKEFALRQQLEKKYKTKVLILKSETVGPTLGRETMIKTLIASGIAVVGILLYMSFAFKNINFAMAAIFALFHDFLIVFAGYSLVSRFFGAEIDTLFVTGLLTSMSFSVHDTIVIFDKIREYKKTEGISHIENSANRALTETLVRSLNNSMTIIFMLLALLLLGGTTIRFFVVTLLIGTITGTYSSPFIATPVFVWLERRKKIQT